MRAVMTSPSTMELNQNSAVPGVVVQPTRGNIDNYVNYVEAVKAMKRESFNSFMTPGK